MFDMFGKLNEAQETINALKLENERLRNADLASCDFVVNWDNLDVFSIERNIDDDNIPYTNIGYFLLDKDNVKVPCEWILYCTIEQHNKLSQEFLERIKK
jgi:hypothetical protein